MNALLDAITFCQLIAILYTVLTVISVILYGKKEIMFCMFVAVASMALDRWLA